MKFTTEVNAGELYGMNVVIDVPYSYTEPVIPTPNPVWSKMFFPDDGKVIKYI